jgi:hypothetical protein
MVENLNSIEDRVKRNEIAKTITGVMLTLNPTLKEQDNYQQTLWDHLHIIGDYKLDIDSEYPTPSPEIKETAPEHLGYKGTLSKYRFYGRNLLEMISLAKDLEEGELKQIYINYIASFMFNSSRNWNDEDLTPEQVVQHIADLSGGAIQLDPNNLNIHVEQRRKRPPSNTKHKKGNKNKNHRRR